MCYQIGLGSPSGGEGKLCIENHEDEEENRKPPRFYFSLDMTRLCYCTNKGVKTLHATSGAHYAVLRELGTILT